MSKHYKKSMCRILTQLYASRAEAVPEDPLLQCRLLLRSRLADQPGSNLFCESLIFHCSSLFELNHLGICTADHGLDQPW